MIKKSQNKIVLLIMLLFFMIAIPNYANAAKVSVGKVNGLKTTSQEANSLTISWNSASNATGYRVYIYNSSTKKYEYYGKTTKRTITINKLSTAKTYDIKVRAYKTVNGNNYYGSYSSILTATTRPSQVKNLKASSQTDSTINLSWSKVARATGYKVYIYNSSTKKYEYYGHSKTNSIAIKNRSAAKTYMIRVRAYVTSNKTNYYGSYSSILTTTTKPAQVTGVKASSTSTSSIKLSWNKATRATGYTIYLYSQYSQSYKKYKSTTSTSITISNLDTAKFYKVYIKAYTTVNGTNYYGKASSTVSQKTKSTQNIKAGIDVSEFQSNINWASVKKSGVEFVMIRIGFRGYGTAGTLVQDACFKSNIQGALNAGLDVGVYFFSYAKDTKEAKAEAKLVIDTLAKYNIPKSKCKYIAYDFESWNQHRVQGVSTAQINKNTTAFLQDISNAGYTPVLYGNYYDLTNRFDTKTILSKINGCKIWLAHYNDKTSYAKYNMWQYSSVGMVNGISGNVDLDVIHF